MVYDDEIPEMLNFVKVTFEEAKSIGFEKYYFAVNICREPVYPHTVGGWLKKFQDDKGFKRVCCHGLRHTYCSLLLSQNVPLQTVSKYMGHSDSTITLQVYSHFIPDTQEKALNALTNLF